MKKVSRNEPCPCGSGKKFKKCCGNPSNATPTPPVPRMLPRHVVWRMQYRDRRYLEHVSESELVTRANDILANLTTLGDDLKIGIYDFRAEGDYLSQIWTHVLEECVLRRYRYPEPLGSAIEDAQLPKYDWPGLDDAVSEFRARALPPSSYLIKYGQARFLRPLLEKGNIRIAPAAMYDDPTLNPAIRDSELQLSLVALPSPPRTNHDTTSCGQTRVFQLCSYAHFMQDPWIG